MMVAIQTTNGGPLPTYRFYRLDGTGRISAAEWIDAADDDDARSKAGSQTPSGGYELWQRDRMIERARPPSYR